MNKKIRLYFIFFHFVVFSFTGLASQEKEHDYPVTIKILPLNNDFSDLDKQKSFSESLESNHSKEKSQLSGARYLDEYGYKTFWEYIVSTELPKKGDAPNPDHLLLKDLGEYRKKNLNNANPMVVRLLLHNEKNESHSLDVGFFVSGEKSYQLTKKGGTEPVNMENISCSEAFKIDYKLNGFLKNDALEISSYSESFKSIIKDRDSFTSKTDKIVKEEFKKRKEELQRIENEIKKAIKENVESKMYSDIGEYISPSSGIIFGVPSFKGIFPITLSSLHDTTSMIPSHFIDVAERIFNLNLRKGSHTSSHFTTNPLALAEYNIFLRHIMKDERLEKLCLNLFGKNALDGNSQDGCFQSAFNYYFTDSEQAFLKWLAKFENSVSFETIDSEKTAKIVKIDVVFFSYLDMCPACRGTISYLLTKKEKDQEQAWLKRRILNFLQSNMAEETKLRYNVKDKGEEIDFNVLCVSLAKCNKGA